MLHLLPITEFRQNLRNHVNQVQNLSKRLIYQLGDANGPYLLAPDTLRALEERHAVNCWAKEHFQSLLLTKYTTLAEGSSTQKLPLDILLGLTDFFGLVAQLCEVLAHPGVKEQASTWSIEEYMNLWISEKPLIAHGTFDKVYLTCSYLFQPTAFTRDHKPTTILEFFQTIQTEALNDQEQEHSTLYRTVISMSKEQREQVNRMLADTCDWMIELLQYQTIFSPNKERVYLKFRAVGAWYEDWIQPLPNLFHYNG